MKKLLFSLAVLALGVAGPMVQSAKAAGNVTTWSASSATASTYPRGKAGILLLDLTGVTSAGPKNVLTAVVVRMVNAADTDVSALHLWVDVNLDGFLQTGTDLQLGTAGAPSGGQYTFSGFSHDLKGNASLKFWVTADFSTVAGNGSKISAQIESAASLGQTGTIAGTFPLSSLGLAAGSGHTVDTNLSFAITTQPGNGNVGEGVQCDYYVTYSDGNPVESFGTPPTVSVRKGGTNSATASWSVLNAPAGQYRAGWTIPVGALPGSDYDFRVVSPTAVAVGNTGPGNDVLSQNFTVSDAGTVPVAWSTSALSAGNVPLGREKVQVMSLTARNDNTLADQNLSSVKITRVNGADSDVQVIRLFVDNGDGAFNAAQDTETGSSGFFTAGAYTFSGLNRIISANGGALTLFVTYDIAPGASAGNKLSAQVVSASHLVQGPFGLSGTFPLSSLGTGQASGMTVDSTLTFQVTGQPGKAKAREAVRADYLVKFSDGIPVTTFTTAPTVKVLRGGTALADAVWSVVDASAGKYMATWVVPDFTISGNDFALVVSSASGSASGNTGPSTVLSTGNFAVDTKVLFSLVSQPVGGKAGANVQAEYTAVFGDGAPVAKFDAAPAVNVSLGTTVVATPIWVEVDAAAGKYKISWEIPNYQTTGSDYNFVFNPMTAQATGNQGSGGELVSGGFSVDTGLGFQFRSEPEAGYAREKVRADIVARYSDGNLVTSFASVPQIKIYRGNTEVGDGTWEEVKAFEGKYRVLWTVPDFQATGQDYSFRLAANSGKSLGNQGPVSAVGTPTFTVDTRLDFRTEIQPSAAAVGDEAWVEFSVRRAIDSMLIDQFDRAPTVMVYKAGTEVTTASWVVQDAGRGRYRAVWQVPAGQSSGLDYSFRVVGGTGTRAGNRGPDSDITTGAFPVTSRSLFWGALPLDFLIVPAGRENVPILTLLVHNAGEPAFGVRGFTLTSLGTNDSAVSKVHLYLDNGNQEFSLGPDGEIELGDPGPFEGGRKVFHFPEVKVAPGTDRVFFLTVDVGEGANTGDRLSAGVEAKTDVELEPGVAARGSFPLYSLEAAHRVNTDLVFSFVDQPQDVAKGSIAQLVFGVDRPDGTKVSALTREPVVDVLKGDHPVGATEIRRMKDRPGVFEARWGGTTEVPVGSDYVFEVRANSAQDGKNSGPRQPMRTQPFALLVDVADLLSFASGNGIVQGCVGSTVRLNASVRDGVGQGVEGVSVAYYLPGEFDPTTQLKSDLAHTNDEGLASLELVIGQKAGRSTVQAIHEGIDGSPLNFSIEGTACRADASLSSLTADPPFANADGETPLRLIVQLRDPFGNPVAGKTVVFHPSNPGAVSVEPEQSPTGAAGIAEASVTSFQETYIEFSAEVQEDGISLDPRATVEFLGLAENRLFQNFPNPFDPHAEPTMIRFNLEAPTPVSLTIYDSAGAPVRTLFQSAPRSSGPQGVQWDGTDDKGRVLGMGRYRAVLRASQFESGIDMVISSGGQGCFIATEVYGSPAHPSVMVLKRFRDRVLRKSSIGRFFIRTYYDWSPGLVERLHDMPRVKSWIRTLLSASASLMEHFM